MNKTGNQLIVRIPDPFDGSARARLSNMGLIDENDLLSESAMTVFASIFTGLFFDDLCDFFEKQEDLLTTYEAFAAIFRKGDYHSMYLLMSVQYDYMRKPLPDPVWWLAGDSAAVKEFMTLFIARLKQLMTSEGLIKPEEGVNPS